MKTTVTASITTASREILRGNLVAFPTETVYGLGANAFDKKAVAKIFKAKNRPVDNPMIVHVHKKGQIPQLGYVTAIAAKLIDNFFPGPLTIVLKKKQVVPKIVTASLATVCIRMPSLPITRKFLKQCGVPVAAPSANLSGKPSPTTWQHVLHDLNDRIPLILKGPPCKHGIESTVVDCTRNPPVLLRPGAVSLEEIKKVVGKVIVPKKVRKALSPGVKYRHYSPKARVVIVKKAGDAKGRKNAFIGMHHCNGVGFAVRVKNFAEYGKRLYWFFRKCDELKVKTIYCELPQLHGKGRALVDRLKKASRRSSY